MYLGIENREKSLGEFIVRCSGPDVPVDVQDAMRVHSVVQVCGYIERSMEIVIIERIQNKAHPKVIEFIKSYFKKGTNFRCPAIKYFLERFDSKRAREFQDFIDKNDDVLELVNSAYTLRNQAAHGTPINVGDKRLAELFDGAKRVVQAVIDAIAR